MLWRVVFAFVVFKAAKGDVEKADIPLYHRVFRFDYRVAIGANLVDFF